MTSVPAFTSLGGGPTVLMLHGIGGGHLAFAPQVETLASAGYRAVAWDMPGYGHSAPIEPLRETPTTSGRPPGWTGIRSRTKAHCSSVRSLGYFRALIPTTYGTHPLIG